MYDLFDSLVRHIASLSPDAFAALMHSRPDVADHLFPDEPDGRAIEVEVYPLAQALVAPEGVAHVLAGLSRAEIQVLMALVDAGGRSARDKRARDNASHRASELYIRLLSGGYDAREVDTGAVRDALRDYVDRPTRPDPLDAVREYDRILADLTDLCLIWPNPETGLTRLHDILPSLLPDPTPDWDGFDPFPPTPTAARHLPIEQVDAQAQAAAVAALDHADRLLRRIAAEPVALLKVGGVGAREIKRLVRACGLDEQQVRFWLHVAETADLVVGHEGRLTATPEYDDWLAAEPGDRYAVLFTGWAAMPTSVLGPFTPNAAQGSGIPLAPLSDRSFDEVGDVVRVLVLSLMAACGAGAVADVGSLAEAVAWHMPLLMRDYLAEAERFEAAGEPPDDRFSVRNNAAAAVTTVLTEAAELGAVVLGSPAPVVRAAFGPSAEDDAAFEEDLTAAMSAMLPAATERIRVQGDMTVVAAGLPSARLAALVDAAAERQPGGGTATVWRITDASVLRWLDAGRTPADLLAALAEFCDGELPQPLRYLVEDAGRRYGQADVIAARAVVVAADAALAAELAVLPALVKLGARRITDTVLVLDAAPEEVLAALRQAGYLPSAHHADGSPILAVAPPRRAAAGVEVISPWSWP